ncbi:hypothetical protein NO108_02777 [Planktothrix rubescens]|nr:hypothetical protein NO108_02777 [Planktothrix rubescens]
MAGDRFPGAIVNAGVTDKIDILPSQIIPPSNQDVKFTVYPIALTPLSPATKDWDVSLELSAPNVPGFAPFPNPRDPNGFGVSESYTYTGKNWVASASATAKVSVSVTDPIPATGNYLFEVDSEVPNNSTAIPDAKGSTGFTQTGFVGRSDPKDYYQFVIPSDQKLKEIKLSGLKDTANLELYRQSAEGGSTVSLKTVTDPSTNDKVITDSLTGGTYYVGVITDGVNSINLSDRGQASTPYSLSVALESATTPVVPGGTDITGPVKRFLNTAVSGHFYTVDAVEANTTRSDPKFREEAAPFKSDGTFTVQRYKNINNGAYFYAANPTDVAGVSKLQVWKLDDIDAFKVYPVGDPTIPANAIPVQRFYNTILDGHFYSTNATDTANASAIGFRSEGIGFYALPTV